MTEAIQLSDHDQAMQIYCDCSGNLDGLTLSHREFITQHLGTEERLALQDQWYGHCSLAPAIAARPGTPEHIPSWGWVDAGHHTLLLLGHIENGQKIKNPICRDFSRSDLGNSQRLATRYGAVLRYCHAFSSWFFWDGRRWARDERGFVVELGKDAATRIADEATIQNGDHERRAHYQWCGTSQARARIDSLVSLSQSSLPISPAEMDKPPYLFNCRNGTLDLRTLTLQEHKQRDMLTKLANVEYVPDATCPQWLSHLELIFAGNEDLIAGFQMICGYTLLAGNPEQVLFILYGTGKNGKTVTMDVLVGILGDYAVNIASESLMTRKNIDAPRGDIARTAGSRLVCASEGEGGATLAESLVKLLTGGDRVTVRRLYESEFEFTPTGKIWLSTNHKPVIRGTDHAVWRRIWLLPFAVTIPEEKRDPHIVDKLLTEKSGILNWMLTGLKAYYENGERLKKPALVSSATETYRQESDILNEFLTDRCAFTGEVSRASLLAEYQDWCINQNEKPVSSRRFNESIRERGIGERKSATDRFWTGISLKGQVKFS